jgi:hypothetical protein
MEAKLVNICILIASQLNGTDRQSTSVYVARRYSGVAEVQVRFIGPQCHVGYCPRRISATDSFTILLDYQCEGRTRATGGGQSHGSSGNLVCNPNVIQYKP